MRKKIPEFKADREAEKFLEQDLSDLDFSSFKPAHFEYKPKNKQVNLRMSEELLSAIKVKASQNGISYQRYIRLAIEQSLGDEAGKLF